MLCIEYRFTVFRKELFKNNEPAATHLLMEKLTPFHYPRNYVFWKNGGME